MKRTLLTLVLLVGLLSLPLVPEAAASGCAAYHTVQFGENLFRIGLKYGLAWPVIASANNIADPRTLKAGRVLCVPAVLPPVTVPPPKPTTPAPPTPVPPASFIIPTFTIAAVVRDQSVTIKAVNFPLNQTFDVLMGPIGTKGINGTKATLQNSGAGAFTATYNIPANLKGSALIAIRLQSSSGFFSYNWFFNNSTK